MRLRTLILMAGAGFAGYFLGSVFGAPTGRAPTADEEPGVAPIARMARDMRLMCADMEPIFREVERAYIDERLSAGEAYSIGQQINRLM